MLHAQSTFHGGGTLVVSSYLENLKTYPTYNTSTDIISQIHISKTPVYLQLRCSRFLG